MLPLPQISSSIPTSALLHQSQSKSNDNKPTDINQLILTQNNNTESVKPQQEEENTQMFAQKSKEQSSLLPSKIEASDESAYSAIVSAQMTKKRKKMNRQHEQAMKEEFIRDPLKVKKMRQTDQMM